MEHSYNSEDFNVGTSIFPGFNDRRGLAICGYEWGDNKNDQARDNDEKTTHDTFHFKSKRYQSPYDLRILKWFSMVGHPLGINDGYSEFDKSILQTNWCDTQGYSVTDYGRFLSEDNIKNFLRHMSEYQPAMLIFMGIRQIGYLQHTRVKSEFHQIFGEEVENFRLERKDCPGRRTFRIGFQRFERVSIVALPHPSGTRGLSDEYISLFKGEIGTLISNYKRERGFS